MASTILVVDRDESWRQSVAVGLRPYLFAVHHTGSAEDAAAFISRKTLDLIVVDSGILDVERLVLPRKRHPVLLVTTSSRDYSLAIASLRLGALDVLERPVSIERITSRVTKALEACVTSPHFLGRRLDRYIKENCKKRDLTLPWLSKRFGISTSYASILLRNGHWGGFRDRLAYHRVMRAQSLLENTDEPLYLVAERCGFSSPSRLSETFSRIAGVAPKKYRQRQL